MPRVFITITVSFGIIASQVQAQEVGNDADLKKLEGTWTVNTWQSDGQKLFLPEGHLREAPKSWGPVQQIILSKDGRWDGITNEKGKIQITRHQFRIDVKKMPRHLDVTAKSEKSQPTSKCIYRLTDDILVICYPQSRSDPRPTEFKTKPKDGLIMITLQRVRNLEKKLSEAECAPVLSPCLTDFR